MSARSRKFAAEYEAEVVDAPASGVVGVGVSDGRSHAGRLTDVVTPSGGGEPGSESGTGGVLVSEWLPDPVSPGGAPLAETAGGVEWLLADPFGSVTDLVDAAGVVTTVRTDPFGDAPGPAATAGPGAADTLGGYGFHGQYQDTATGLYDVLARDYNPATGSFTRPDPVVHPLGMGWTQTHHYGWNNPGVYTDPSGEWPDEEDVAGAYNWSQGVADSLSHGLVADGRRALNVDYVNYESSEYQWQRKHGANLYHVGDAAAGFGDFVTGGLTNKIRDWNNSNDIVNHDSRLYVVGQVGGALASLAGGARAVVTVVNGLRNATRATISQIIRRPGEAVRGFFTRVTAFCRGPGGSLGDRGAFDPSQFKMPKWITGGSSVGAESLRRSVDQIAREMSLSTRAVKDAIHAIKRQQRLSGERRSPDLLVDTKSGDVYIRLENGDLSDAPIGNLYDWIK